MWHKSLAKKRKTEASEINSPALAHVRATSQHVDSGIPTTSGLTAIVDADMRQDPRSEGHFAGYIFMCNAKTKQDCFIYRVFGLPASRIDVVEQIKPNAKLFLYDFDVRLLYGPYIADSVGKLALEPYAFGGRFPAQVKFSIANDCLPVPEAAFKDAIKENYLSKFKFKQDLSYEQVDKLVSLFRPITLRSPKQAPLTYPSYHSVLEIPMPLHSTHNQIRLSRGGEFPSNLYHSRIAYESARPPQRYHPDDPSFQQRDTHLRNAYIPQQAISPVVHSSPSAKSYYDQDKRLLRPIYPPQIQGSTPLPAIRSSTLLASHWVAMPARTQIPNDQTSNLNPSSSNAQGASHVNNLQSASNYTELGYHNQFQGYPGTHETAAVPSAENAYGGELSSSSSLYTQREGPQPGSSEVGAVNAYPYYNDGTNNTGLSYGHGYQPYSRLHQDVNNVAYGNQTYPNSQVPVPAASADPNAGSIYSNCSTTVYTYREGYTGYYQAMPLNSDQNSNGLPVQAYAQTQALPGLAQTVPSGSAPSYYNQGY